MKLFKRIYDKLFVNYGRISREVLEKIKNDPNENYIVNKLSNFDDDFIAGAKKKVTYDYVNAELLLLKPSPKKKILLVGFYGAPNLGDELMLETLLQYFPDFNNVDLTIMLADNPNYDIGDYPAVHVIHYPKTLYDFNVLAQYYDVLIFGGGAIIDDRLILNKDAYKGDLGTILIKLSERFLVWNKEVYSVGLSSISKFTNKEYIEKLSTLINNSKYFSVRDENSYNNLLNCCNLENNKKVDVIHDIVIANKNIPVNSKRNSKIKDIGIVWIPYSENVDKLKELLLKLKKNYKVHLIPFYGYTDFDINMYKEIINELKIDKEIMIEKFARNMNELVEIFSRCDFLIAMRYHAVLVGNLLNVPTLSICYDKHPHYINKMNYLAKQFNSIDMVLASELDVENINGYIKKTLTNYFDNDTDIESMMEDARKTISSIIKLATKKTDRKF